MAQLEDTEGREGYKLLCVSTTALRPATSQYLASYERQLPFIVADYGEGHFVSCQNLSAEDSYSAENYAGTGGQALDDLHAVRVYAVRHGYRYVMFDRDAEVPEGLEDYSHLW